MATKSATQRKKSAAPKRHSISSGNPRSYGDMYKDDKTRSIAPTTMTTSTTGRRALAQEAPSQVDTVNWRQEYDYVLRDLRTLGIVTTALFAVIILAGFFM